MYDSPRLYSPSPALTFGQDQNSFFFEKSIKERERYRDRETGRERPRDKQTETNRETERQRETNTAICVIKGVKILKKLVRLKSSCCFAELL